MRKIDAHIVILRKRKTIVNNSEMRKRIYKCMTNHPNRSGSPVEGVLEAGIDVKEMVWIPFG